MMDKMRILKVIGGIGIGVAAVAAAPFTGGGSILLGASALGLGTAAAVGSAVAAGAAGGVLASGILHPGKKLIIKKGIFILGPSHAGKSTIYKFLQGTSNLATQTTVKEYDEFKYNIDVEKSIIIRKGIDIGGGVEFVDRFYLKMITDKEIDYGFFVFNSFKYINEKEYRRDVNSRLHFIYEKEILKKKTIIVGSYLDNFSLDERPQVANKIKELTVDKRYKVLLSNEHLHLLNLTDEETLRIFFKNIFN